jgi:uncharacterized protein (UPF0332 family)
LTRELIDTAYRLLNITWKHPRQNDLKRAVSTAYFAMFECLARQCADTLVGTGKSRSDGAWRQAFRALDHGFAKQACGRVEKLGFPDNIVHFANIFVRLQEERHRADYDPSARYDRIEVMLMLWYAAEAIHALRKAKIRDRRAFAVLVLLRSR